MWKVLLEDLLRSGQLGHRMYVARERVPGRVEIMQPPTIKVQDSALCFDHRDALLDDSMPENGVRSFLQAMSDAAWDIGIKPKQLENHASELKATKYHLEDMRLLAGAKK